MTVEGIFRQDDDRAVQALVGAAAALLGERRRDIPRDFVADLYGYAPLDDLRHYRPEELAGIAEQCWSFLLERKPGSAKLGFAPTDPAPDVALLDILNDDMPFLVDSVLGELNERGLAIRLIIHPVFTVERNDAGHLIAFKGIRKGDGLRESFMHIHIGGLEDAARAPMCYAHSKRSSPTSGLP